MALPDQSALREALLVATTTVEEWEARHGRKHPDPEGFRRAAVEYGKAALRLASDDQELGLPYPSPVPDEEFPDRPAFDEEGKP